MTSSLNSSQPEPYEVLRDRLRAHWIAALGFEPAGLVVAPCRVKGYHFYSNAGFFTREREKLAENLPADFEAEVTGGFVNVRVREPALRRAVHALAERAIAPETPGLSARLHALLALREDEKNWGVEAADLAWLLVRGETAGDYKAALTETFEAYFRQGYVDHELVRAALARIGEKE